MASCEAPSAPFEIPKRVCQCPTPCLMSGSGIPAAEAKLCRKCRSEPRIEGTATVVSVCVLNRGHRGRHSWGRS
jgi:hypothetical protein